MGEEANSSRMTDDFSDPEICKPETEGENKEEATKQVTVEDEVVDSEDIVVFLNFAMTSSDSVDILSVDY